MCVSVGNLRGQLWVQGQAPKLWKARVSWEEECKRQWSSRPTRGDLRVWEDHKACCGHPEPGEGQRGGLVRGFTWEVGIRWLVCGSCAVLQWKLCLHMDMACSDSLRLSARMSPSHPDDSRCQPTPGTPVYPSFLPNLLPLFIFSLSLQNLNHSRSGSLLLYSSSPGKGGPQQMFVEWADALRKHIWGRFDGFPSVLCCFLLFCFFNKRLIFLTSILPIVVPLRNKAWWLGRESQLYISSNV